MVIQHYLIEAAAKYPNKKAIIEIHNSSSYQELLTGSERVAAWLLDENVASCDRVGILLDEMGEYAMAYFGILMAGAVVVALNTQTSPRTLRDIINDAEISILITHAKFMKYIQEIDQCMPSLRLIALNQPPQLNTSGALFKQVNFTVVLNEYPLGNRKQPSIVSDDQEMLAQIIYTSGTTGKPKGVMLKHSNLMANTRSIIEYLNLTDEERHMVVLPFFYSFGNSIFLTHVAACATMIVHQSMVYPKVVLDLMEREKTTGLSGVPSTFAVLLSLGSLQSYSFPSLRYIAQAGGPMTPKLAQQLKSTFPDAALYIMYGQTEASARLSYLHPDDFYKKPGSIGKAIPGVTLMLLSGEGNAVQPGEVGEIVAVGENVMAGYWKDPEGTAKVLKKEGLWTGDLARMDDEGYYSIVSRKSEMIKSGAHRIGPKEVEEVILEYDPVKEVAVFGVEDDILGEAIVACIIKKNSISCNYKDILLHCKKNIPAFKVPKHIFFVESFPKTATGKVQKNELKKTIAGLLSKEQSINQHHVISAE